MSKTEIDEPTGIDTTGHEWDGIKELNNPLPRWWLWTFYATVVWGIGYTIAYPAWPLLDRATPGLLGYSTRAEVAERIAQVEAQNAPLVNALVQSDITALEKDAPVYQFAVASGASVFRAQCSQCHGAGAAGALGYPNLLDDDWLWGGDIASIAFTVEHGIRNTQSDEARYSEMPKYGEFWEPEQIDQTVQYVLSLSGREHDSVLAAAGATLFEENCTACHGPNGAGMREQGGPNLTDSIWLYGDDTEAITASIANARFGVMPAWGKRLSEADVKAVSLYIHQLGGGE